jgi:thioredoxin-related protein
MHDKFADKVVVFLEESDFDATGKFTQKMHNKSMLVMVGATFCPHCTQHGAPVFNEFAIENKAKLEGDKTKVITGVVYADGEPSEQNLGRLLGKTLGVRSIPLFIFFGPDGTIKEHLVGAQELGELKSFVNKNLA